MYCDNNLAINITHNLVKHGHTKYIEVERQIIKEKLDSGLISTPYVSAENADILMNRLPNTCTSFSSRFPLNFVY